MPSSSEAVEANEAAFVASLSPTVSVARFRFSFPESVSPPDPGLLPPPAEWPPERGLRGALRDAGSLLAGERAGEAFVASGFAGMDARVACSAELRLRPGSTSPVTSAMSSAVS